MRHRVRTCVYVHRTNMGRSWPKSRAFRWRGQIKRESLHDNIFYRFVLRFMYIENTSDNYLVLVLYPGCCNCYALLLLARLDGGLFPGNARIWSKKVDAVTRTLAQLHYTCTSACVHGLRQWVQNIVKVARLRIRYMATLRISYLSATVLFRPVITAVETNCYESSQSYKHIQKYYLQSLVTSTVLI